MLDKVNKIVCIVSKVLISGSAAAIGIMTLLVTIATIMRYVVGSSLSLTEDLSSFLFVSSLFLAFPYATLEGKHIQLTMLTDRLSARVRAFCGIATSLAAFFYLFILIKLFFDFTLEGYRYNSHSETGDLYELPWRAIILVNVAWFAVVTLVLFIKGAVGIIVTRKVQQIPADQNIKGGSPCQH